MINALAEELRLRQGYMQDDEVETIYFGGGTPSLLTQNEMRLLMSTIRELFPVTPDPEVTLEANPDNISESYLEILKDIGVNRISLGTQSFHEPHLNLLNRSHDAQQSKSSLELIKKAGFDNFTADLIYGIPNDDHSIWQADIEEMLSFDPPHLSCYHLTVESNTVFGKWAKSGKFQEADDHFAYQQFDILMDRLSANGYEHYEISNFSKPGYESRHNSNYWDNKRYLGIGPGAHSYDLYSRQANIANNALYIKSIEQGQVTAETEELSKTDLINEFIITKLRTSLGIDSEKLRKLYGYDLPQEQNKEVRQLEFDGYLTLKDGHLRLTRKGKFVTDAITEKLFID